MGLRWMSRSRTWLEEEEEEEEDSFMYMCWEIVFRSQ